ncbi:MAG: folate family ECF transporter S component [Clostridia bacterium]|nr:folate family ECF transporter S component [Clostridia bacterium]
MKSRKKVITLVSVSAVLVALEIVLNRFCSINTAGLKIGFAFVPPTLAAIAFGPWIGAAVYATSDLLGAVIFPIGPYHPGFTACAALMGIVSGFLLCKNPINIRRESERGSFSLILSRKRVPLLPNILAAVIINCILFGLIINTAWVSMLYDSKTYWGWFLYRILEYSLMIPVQIVIIPLLIRISDPVRKILRMTAESPEEK